MNQRKNQKGQEAKTKIPESPLGPAIGIQTPEEKKRQQQERHEMKKPAAPGDTI